MQRDDVGDAGGDGWGSPAANRRGPSTVFLPRPSSTAGGQRGGSARPLWRERKRKERSVGRIAGNTVLGVGGAGTGSGRFTNLLPSTSAKEEQKKTKYKEKKIVHAGRLDLLNMTNATSSTLASVLKHFM